MLTLLFRVAVVLGIAHQAVAVIIAGVWIVWMHLGTARRVGPYEIEPRWNGLTGDCCRAAKTCFRENGERGGKHVNPAEMAEPIPYGTSPAAVLQPDASGTGESRGRMSLWPKEHGAYGQAAFPLLAAFGVAGPSPAGVLLGLAVAAGFLAHEPAVVLLGRRGPKAQRQMWHAASRWFAWCALAGVLAGVAALVALPAGSRWAVAVPAIPALVLAIMTIVGREKSWYGELLAVLAFSGAAVPVCLAAGAPLATAVHTSVPFALLFAASTLAVRVIILRVRAGGDPRGAAITRCAAVLIAVGGAAGLVSLSAAGLLSWTVPIASAPGLLTSFALALWPPPPARLRRVGWTLVAVSIATLVLVVTS